MQPGRQADKRMSKAAIGRLLAAAAVMISAHSLLQAGLQPAHPPALPHPARAESWRVVSPVQGRVL